MAHPGSGDQRSGDDLSLFATPCIVVLGWCRHLASVNCRLVHERKGIWLSPSGLLGVERHRRGRFPDARP